MGELKMGERKTPNLSEGDTANPTHTRGANTKLIHRITGKKVSFYYNLTKRYHALDKSSVDVINRLTDGVSSCPNASLNLQFM